MHSLLKARNTVISECVCVYSHWRTEEGSNDVIQVVFPLTLTAIYGIPSIVCITNYIIVCTNSQVRAIFR